MQLRFQHHLWNPRNRLPRSPSRLTASYAQAWITNPATRPRGSLRQLPSNDSFQTQLADSIGIEGNAPAPHEGSSAPSNPCRTADRPSFARIIHPCGQTVVHAQFLLFRSAMAVLNDMQHN